MISKSWILLIFLIIAKSAESDVTPGGAYYNSQFDASAKSSYNVNTGPSESADTDDGASECIPYECGGKIIHPTPSPINITTSKTTPTNEGPITAVFESNGYLNMTNTGRTVLTKSIGDIGLKTTLTGGILGNKKYVTHEGRIIWNCDECLPAASIVDQKWTPLEVVIVYYSSEYKSFEEALKSGNRRALVILSFPVKVEQKCNSNKAFDNFLEYVKHIEKADNYTIIPGSTYGEWYAVLPKTENAYAYDGSYTDSKNGVQYNTALIIRLPLTDETACISPEQFKKFKILRNQDEELYCNAQKSYHTCGRKVFSIKPIESKS